MICLRYTDGRLITTNCGLRLVVAGGGDIVRGLRNKILAAQFVASVECCLRIRQLRFSML
jgi:hypothetical protein